MDKAVIYIRVSTEEQTKSLSLPTQEKGCRRFCEQNGWEVSNVFTEAGESAKTTDRPEFKRLLNFCCNRKNQIKFVVVYDISRYSRNSEDHLTIRTLLKTHGVLLRCVTQNIDESPQGRFTETVLSAAAQLDNDMKAERTRAGMLEALRRGRWTHQPPLGYVPNRKPSLVPDAETASLVRELFGLCATGRYTSREVIEKATALGLRSKTGQKLSMQSFNSMLKNPVYKGWIVSAQWGVCVRGDFEPLVSEDLYDKVHAVMWGKSPIRTRYHRNHPDFPCISLVLSGRPGFGA